MSFVATKNIAEASKERVWNEDYSLVVTEKGKCLITFPIWPYAAESVDLSIGLIAILLDRGIRFNEAYIRPSDCRYEEDPNPKELVFEFDRRHAKRIRAIEKEYLTQDVMIEAKVMSEFIVFILNYIGTKIDVDGLISEYKTLLKEGKKRG